MKKNIYIFCAGTDLSYCPIKKKKLYCKRGSVLQESAGWLEKKIILYCNGLALYCNRGALARVLGHNTRIVL